MIKEKLKQLSPDRRLKALYEKYERVLIPGFLLFGFIADVITFKTLEVETTLQFLGVYAALAGVALMYNNVYDGLKASLQSAALRYARVFSGLVSQFTLGALLSASLVFYWFSGAVSVSWPILSIMAAVMISSELFRHFYLRPAVQLTLYAFVLLSYASYLLPFIFNALGAWIFMLGGLMSTSIVMLMVFVLTRFSAEIQEQRMRILAAAVAVFAGMSMLYAFNAIPPLPLSIREAGVYRNIVRTADGYEFLGAEETFLQSIIPGRTIVAEPGRDVYVFTSIFAPTNFQTTIYHRWEYYDEAKKKWVPSSLLHYTMRGGRENGYRGYSMKSRVAEGRWRVSVENENGQVLGIIRFTMKYPDNRSR